jgi:hypothetical protein
LEATIRKELEKLLKDGIIFLVKYFEWVSNLVHVRKATDHIRLCIGFHALNQAIIKDHFPLPNTEMILQQVAGSQMMSLLDVFFGYNQIKVKRADKYKTTFITHWGTLNYERMPSGLSNASGTFKRPVQVTFDDLIGTIIHIYLDDLIVCFKGLSIVLKFQDLWLGPFKISFFLGTNSYILKYLQERLFSYNTNGSHLKHYVEPT